MRLIVLGLALVCSVADAQLTLKTAEDALRRLRVAEDALQRTEDELASLKDTVDSLSRRLAEVEKLRPQPTESKPFDNVIPSSEQVKPEPKKAEQMTEPPTVKLLSLQNCPPCDRWWNEFYPRLKAQGWNVQRVTVSSGRTPRFEICWNNKCVPFQGWLTMAKLSEIVYGDKRTTAWTHESPDGYQERWTYPGDIRDHLPDVPHTTKIQVGWTEETCERIHDAQHDVIGPWPPNSLTLASGVPCVFVGML